MNIPTTLRERVQRLEREIEGYNDSANQSETQRNDTQTQYDSVRSQMGWREKHLAGWFGGDKSVVQRSRSLEGSLNDYDTKISQARTAMQTTEDQIDEAIKSYLVQNDPTYQQLDAALAKVADIRDATDSYIGRIDNALSEIDDAQTMETVDLFTKNKGISALSWMENDEAQEAINAVKGYTGNFQGALAKYNDFLKNQQSIGIGQVEIGDGIDFVFDMVFDGFDFMSLFTLDNLDNAESELGQLRSKVSEVQGKINEHYQKTERNVTNYAHNIREACR